MTSKSKDYLSDAKDFLAQFHDRVSICPFNWLEKGKTLWHAAEVLWARVQPTIGVTRPEETKNLDSTTQMDIAMESTWCMLAGLSLEVLAKGLIIAKEPERFKSADSGWAWRTSSHDVSKLITQASHAPDKTQEAILQGTKMCVVWAGKYPVSKKRSEMDFPLIGEDWHPILASLAERLVAEYKALTT